MIAATNELSPTSRRPVPLRTRSDLKAVRISFRGTDYWSIKEPISLRYYRLREDQYYLLQHVDGQRTLEELQKIQQQRYPHLHWGLTAIQSLISDLHEKRLVTSARTGQAEGLEKQRRKTFRQKVLATLMSFLFLRFPGWYPEPFLRRCYPFVRWMLRPWTVILGLLAVCSALGVFTIQFDALRQQLPEFQQFFAWPNLLYLWLTMAVIKVFHEFGHGFTCHHFGGESHSIGVMLLVFSPTLYCDVSDAWMLRSKWKRIAIGAAGMYVEVVLSALALFTWWFTQVGLLHHLALNVFFVTTVSTVIFNANPLMRLDGYYMLSDLLEIPNLKQRSSRLILQWIGEHCFGIEPHRDPFEPERGKGWLAVYAIASVIYRCVLMLGIGWFLYTVLKPYRLEMLGVLMITVSIGSMIGQFLYQVVKMVRAPRVNPLSRKRMLISGIILCGVAGLVAMVPVPLYIQVAAQVQPHEVRHVHSQTPGLLTELRRFAGQEVKAGDVIAVLANDDLQDHLWELELESRLQEKRIRTARSLEQTVERQLAEDHLANLNQQIEEVEQQLARLTIHAPVSGRIVSPERIPEPKLNRQEDDLPRWHGEPLQESNLGAYIEPRTHICSIAPDDRLELVLYIDQSHRNELEVGDHLRIKFDHLVDQIYEGEISEVSQKSIDFVPTSLSNKSGGPLATVTDKSGRERLTSLAWQAKVTLDRDTELFVSGQRGRARLIIAHRSLGSWLYRWFRETVHFRL